MEIMDGLKRIIYSMGNKQKNNIASKGKETSGWNERNRK